MRLVPKDWKENQVYKDGRPMRFFAVQSAIIKDRNYMRMPVEGHAIITLLLCLASENPKTGEIDASIENLSFRFPTLSENTIEAGLSAVLNAGLFVPSETSIPPSVRNRTESYGSVRDRTENEGENGQKEPIDPEPASQALRTDPYGIVQIRTESYESVPIEEERIGENSSLTGTRGEKRRRKREGTHPDAAPPLSSQGDPLLDEIPPLPESLDNTLFREALLEWITFKRRKKKSLSVISISGIIRQAAQFGSALSAQAINKAISNGWNNIYFEQSDAEPKHRTEKRANEFPEAIKLPDLV